MKAIIVEDMPEAIDLLQIDLKNHCPEVEVIGVANSVLQAAKLLRQTQPDIIFLDVSLGDGTGFDLLEIFPDLNVHIIFLTASEEHAVRAFQFSATDYLLKPIDTTLLKKSVTKVLSTKKPEKQVLDIIRQSIKNPQTLPTKLSLHTLDKIIVISIAEIVRCESDGNNTWFYMANNTKHYTTKTLKHFEDLLSGHDFIRTHQSHLVNFNYIIEFCKKDGGMIKLKQGDEIPVSFRKKAEILKKFENM